MNRQRTVCYSGASSRTIRHRLGTPHYSYRFAEEKFLACLSDMGVDAHFLAMPEFYSHASAYAELPTFEGRHVHMLFRSTEDVRILKSGYNIACFAWEFPFIKDTTDADEHPFLNQKRMLQLCDEIWVPCTYTKGVLDAHGVANTHVIPAPITAPTEAKPPRPAILARIGHLDALPFVVNFLGATSAARGFPLYAAFDDVRAPVGDVFLSIFNPEDFRKNLDALVRGFDMFQQKSGRHDLLIIKALTSADRFDLQQVVRDVMMNKMASGTVIHNEAILVVNEYLDADDLALLYGLADFYVCTSIAEGQNLPLQEAMIQGVVPVTTCNTAMLDYIDDDDAIVIAAERRRNTCSHLAGNVAGKPYDVEVCTARQVATALDTACGLEAARRQRLSTAARARIAQRFSREAVRPLVEARLDAIGGGGRMRLARRIEDAS